MVGLGKKIVMRRFDIIAERFESAMIQAKEVLKEQGFHHMDAICNEILKKGGIAYL